MKVRIVGGPKPSRVFVVDEAGSRLGGFRRAVIDVDAERDACQVTLYPHPTLLPGEPAELPAIGDRFDLFVTVAGNLDEMMPAILRADCERMISGLASYEAMTEPDPERRIRLLTARRGAPASYDSAVLLDWIGVMAEMVLAFCETPAGAAMHEADPSVRALTLGLWNAARRAAEGRDRKADALADGQRATLGTDRGVVTDLVDDPSG